MYIMPPVFNAGDTVYFFFDTYDSNGASVTITGLAVTDIEVYKNGSVTKRSSDNGYTLLDTDGIDFDGTVGLHGFSIDTSDNTDTGFWTDGAQYLVNVNAITVDSQTVRFSYMLTLGYLLRPTTAGRKLDVSTGGEAGLDWANIGSPTTTVGLSGTTVKTATDVETDTADIQSRLPAALVSGRIDASVGAMAANTVTATAIADGAIDAATFAADVDAEILSYLVDDATRIDASSLNTATVTTIPAIVADTNELQTDWVNGGRLDLILDATATQSSINALNDLSAAEVNAEVDTALADINLDHLMKIAVDTDFSTTVHNDSALAYLAHDGIGTGGLFDRTTDSLEAIRNRGDIAWITATGFSTHSAADVWAVSTRELTSGANIVLAKGVGVTGFNDVSTAQVNAEVDTALADINLDHLISSGVDTDFDTTVHTDSVIGYLAHNGIGTDGNYDRETDSLEALYDAIQSIDVGTGTGGGEADWTTAERTAIRTILGFNSSGVVGDPTSGILDTIRDNIAALDFSTFDSTTDTVILADGVTHGGTTAKLRLGSSGDPALWITNNNGTSVEISSSGAFIGHGLLLTSGTNGAALRLSGGTGIDCRATGGNQAIYLEAASGAKLIDGLSSGNFWATGYVTQMQAGLSTLTSTQVNTQVDIALSDYDAPTHAELISEIDAVQVDIAALNNISTAQVSTQVTNALNSYDPPTHAELVSEINSVQSDIAALSIPTASQNATAILAAGDIDGFSLEETLKLCLAALAGKLSGAATTTVTIRAADDSKNRIVATVDANGNRSAVTLDVTG